MRSADPGKLLPTTHVKNAVAIDSAFERHCSGRFLRDYTDAGGLLGNRQPEQDIESRTGVFQWHNGESTLVGHIERGEGRSEKSGKLRPGALFRIIGSVPPKANCTRDALIPMVFGPM